MEILSWGTILFIEKLFYIFNSQMLKCIFKTEVQPSFALTPNIKEQIVPSCPHTSHL